MRENPTEPPPKTTIEATKRTIYLVGLPLGAVASLLLVYAEWAQGTLHLVDQIGLPLLSLLLIGLTVGFWRRSLPFVALEVAFFLGFSSMLLASLGYSLTQVLGPEADLRNLIGLGYWSPVLYAMALLIFGVRTGIRLSIGVFLASLGVWLGQIAVSENAFPFERSLVFQLYASDALLLLLLYGLGAILELQAQQAAALEHDANTDPLTLLKNRRFVGAQLEHEAARSTRSGVTFSLIMLDLDHFKEINDRFGHDAGDATLRGVAALLSLHARSADILGRWGGEEFVLVLPELPLHDAAEVAERLREIVARHPFGGVGSATASFGVAEYVPGESVLNLVTRADGALYRAKASGRNCVMPPFSTSPQPDASSYT